MEEDDLELLLGARFSGLADAQRYAETMERIARAEKSIGDASRSNVGSSRAAMTYAAPSSRGGFATAPNPPAIAGGGGRGFSLPKLSGRAGAAAEGLERAVGPAIMRSIGGGVAGGAAAEVVGTVAKAAGPVGAVVSTIVTVGKALHDLAQSSAAATNALMSLRVSTGGTTLDAARVQAFGAVGATGAGARSFQERITGSDEGRSAAAQIGISNARAPYGSMRFGDKYLDAIQRTAEITDENQRQRLAYMLGIEEEVAQYSRLSSSSRRAMERSARATAAINDPAQARSAAEFEANAKRISDGWNNFTTAAGKLAFPVVSALQEEAAQFFNALAWVTDGLAKVNEYSPLTQVANLQKEAMRFAGNHALVGPGAGSQGGMAQSATTQNTQATLALTAAIDRLTGNLGGGANAKEYLGNAQKAPFMHDALVAKAVRHGAMG